ncbi:DBH-like monooxygenase protein 1 homolog [Centruroides vittatus]|uniref:DBH-like monooxygenase protein 1 homolog n=1 Tax=Centruroides vittatus TaxID=120091 RepID=UPI00350EB2FE
MNAIYETYCQILEVSRSLVEVASRGWVGLGISPNGGMEGSDVVIGWINNGKATFHVRFWKKLTILIASIMVDLAFLVLCIFTVSARNFDQYSKLDDNYEIWWSTDEDSITFQVEVATRGWVGLGISPNGGMEGSDVVIGWINNGKATFHVRVPGDRDTEYYCKFFRTPELSRKHHVVKLEAIIEPGNEKIVHHMILHECTGVETDRIAPYLNEEYTECYTEENVRKFSFCFNIIGGWAVGGESFIYPDQAGLPLGIPEVKWFLLEIHYDNPSLKRGIVDNSGFRITYTPKLRKHDAAVLAVGNLWYPCVFIPPKQKEYIVAGHAHPSCLRLQVPPEGIKIYSFLLHSHVIGKQIIVRHFRNREELLPLARDLNYDFNFQQFKYLFEERTVLPNDQLVVECVYDSSKRDKVTFGGLSTKEEMCLAFFGYYPKINISVLFTCPSPYNIVKRLGVKEMSDDDRFVISPSTGKNQSYYEFLNTYPWDYQSVNSVQNAMRYGPQLNFCPGSGNILTSLVLARYPRVQKIHKQTYKCKSNN